jgi:dTDP-D-glucose 4,6-dehydratase
MSSTHGRDWKCTQNFAFLRTPEEKIPLGRVMRRLEDNICVDLRGMGWEVVDWIHLAKVRDQWWALVNTVMKRRARSLTCWVTI